MAFRPRLPRITPFILAGLVGLVGNIAADEVGLVNGFCAMLVVITSWVLLNPDRVETPEERALLGDVPPTELNDVQKRYVGRARIGLTAATLAAAVLGGWRHAAFYSFVTFVSAIVLCVGGTYILFQHTKRRVARRTLE